eukprot:gene14821-14955_t
MHVKSLKIEPPQPEEQMPTAFPIWRHDRQGCCPFCGAGNSQPPGVCSAEAIVRAFNTWAYKREQPSDVNLMTSLVAAAIEQNAPVPFLCYWGKGPRNTLAFPDITCLDFLIGMSRRIQQIYAPGVDIKLIFTDTHARLNGHEECNMQNYFGAVRDHARELGFSTTLLSEIVAQAGESARDELHLDPLQPEMLGKLSEMALKWYRGAGSIEQGAAQYFAMNMVEKRSIELAYPRSVFMTFNGSEFRNLFPKSLPVFYMYSMRRGVSIKPWSKIMHRYKILLAGDTAIVVEFGDAIDRDVSALVLSLSQCLDGLEMDGLIETVPTFRSVLVQFDPLVLPMDKLVAHINRFIQGAAQVGAPSRHWLLPVCYDVTLALDLEHVASQAGLSPAQVVELHASQNYHVYMLGFLPGQAYMGDVVPQLALNRRDTPRLKVPAGVVGIAAGMTCIFPMETPCGWHILGRSPIKLWQPGAVSAGFAA